jgi:hypothetical protein
MPQLNATGQLMNTWFKRLTFFKNKVYSNHKTRIPSAKEIQKHQYYYKRVAGNLVFLFKFINR